MAQEKFKELAHDITGFTFSTATVSATLIGGSEAISYISKGEHISSELAIAAGVIGMVLGTGVFISMWPEYQEKKENPNKWYQLEVEPREIYLLSSDGSETQSNLHLK